DLSTMMALSGTDMAGFSAYRRADGVMAEAHINLHRTTSAQRARIQQELEGMPYVTKVEVIPSSFFATSPQKPDATTRPAYQPNPYGPTIASGTRFYGREGECQRISTLLHDSSQNTTILVWGQKRIGKTSLMLHMQDHALGDFLPVYLDVQRLKDSTTSQFLYQLMNLISSAYKEKSVEAAQEISVPALNKLRKDPLSYFDTFMDRLQQMRHAQSLVVILDEFQCLCSLREEMISRDAIFSRLRSHALHGRGVRFILSGGGLRSQLTDQCNMTSLFNIAHDARLGCLERADAHRLVAEGLARAGNVTEQAIELLLDLTAGHPFYLQLLCHRLYEQV
ncbi:MAG: AAA family ATPase, partial [Ktedonobacteraceae bacterium]